MEEGTVSLQDPGNSKVGATAMVKCNFGFNETTLSIKCLQNGQWETPVCTKISKCDKDFEPMYIYITNNRLWFKSQL